MTPEYRECADRFDRHYRTCSICSVEGTALCPEGLRLLLEFYDALKGDVYGDGKPD